MKSKKRAQRPIQLFQSLEDMFTCVFICRHNTIEFIELYASHAMFIRTILLTLTHSHRIQVNNSKQFSDVYWAVQQLCAFEASGKCHFPSTGNNSQRLEGREKSIHNKKKSENRLNPEFDEDALLIEINDILIIRFSKRGWNYVIPNLIQLVI